MTKGRVGNHTSNHPSVGKNDADQRRDWKPHDEDTRTMLPQGRKTPRTRTRMTTTNGGVGNLVKRYSNPTTRKNAAIDNNNNDNPRRGWKLCEEGVTPSLGWGTNATIPAPTTVGKAQEGNRAESGGSAPFFSFLFGSFCFFSF